MDPFERFLDFDADPAVTAEAAVAMSRDWAREEDETDDYLISEEE